MDMGAHPINYLGLSINSYITIMLFLEYSISMNSMESIIWKRAEDIHTLLDHFALQPFADFTDLNQIGIAGFSIGGTTGICLTGGKATRLDNFVPTPNEVYPGEFNTTAIEKALPTLDKKKMMQSWKDTRIKAAFLMAPAWAWIFDKDSLQKITIPTYIVAPNADNVLVTQNNAGFFSKNIPKSLYQIIPGKVSHYVFISIPKEKNTLPSNLSFLIEDAPDIDRQWIQFEVARDASDFFQSVFSSSSAQKF